jgi:hypothetical protein
MMNTDMARAGDPVLKDKKKKEESKDASITGGDNPLFSSEESKLNIEVPEGWKTVS